MFKRCRRKLDATKMVYHPIIRDSVYDFNGKNEMKTNLSTYVREKLGIFRPKSVLEIFASPQKTDLKFF